jgi:hypothetical protein
MFRKCYPATPISFKTCFKTEVILHLHKLCIKKPGLNLYKTLELIQFDNQIPGVNYKQIIKKKGKPESAKYELVGDKLIKVIGFRAVIYGRAVRIVYFFIDNCFFLGEYQFRSYDKNLLESISTVLRDKYQCNIHEQDSTYYITDKCGSLICFDNTGFNLCVQYYFPQLEEIDQYLSKVILKTTMKGEIQLEEGKNLMEVPL